MRKMSATDRNISKRLKFVFLLLQAFLPKSFVGVKRSGVTGQFRFPIPIKFTIPPIWGTDQILIRTCHVHDRSHSKTTLKCAICYRYIAQEFLSPCDLLLVQRILLTFTPSSFSPETCYWTRRQSELQVSGHCVETCHLPRKCSTNCFRGNESLVAECIVKILH